MYTKELKYNERSGPKLLSLIFIIVSAIVVTVGYLYYDSQKKNEIKKVQAHLNTIADYKVAEIEKWLDANFYKGIIIFANQHFNNHLTDWLNDRDNGLKKNEILSLLTFEKKNKGLKNALICDVEGQTILSSTNFNTTLDLHELKYLKQAVAEQKPLFTDLYKCNIDDKIHIASYIPLVQEKNGKSTVLAVVVFIIDPYNSLYPLIQTWPEESNTAEAFITRKEDDHIIFLNELRFKKNTALKLRIPLTNKNIPVVMAANGIEGIVEGIDYRGAEVFAAIKKVPRSNWNLVAKVDKEEIFKPFSEKAILINGTVLTLLMFIVVTSFYYSKRTKINYYKKLYEIEKEKHLIQKNHELLINNANDIILLTEPTGRILEANRKAIDTYGYSLEELKSLSIKDLQAESTLNDIELEQTKTKSLASNRFETLHKTKSGKPIPVEISARFITIDSTGYVQSIIRDISERKYAEEKIRQTNKLLKNIIDGTQDAIFIKDKEGKYILVNEAASAYVNIPIDKIIGKDDSYLFTEGAESIFENDRKVLQEGITLKTEETLVSNGVKRIFDVIKFPWKDSNDNIIGLIGIDRDITEKQLLLDKITESESKYRRFFEEDLTGDYKTTIDGKMLMCNEAFVKIIGCNSVEDTLKINANDLYPEKQMRDDFIRKIKENKKLELYETTLTACDGRTVYVIENVIGIFDENDNLTEIFGYVFDITARKEAELALKESESRYRQLFEANPHPMWVYDLDTLEFLEVNDSAIDHYGYSKEEFLNMTIKEIRPEEEVLKLIENVNYSREHIREGIDHAGIWKHRKKDGTIISVEITSHPINFNNHNAKLVLVNDVTLKIEAEKKLIESEEQYRHLAENITDVVWIFDINSYKLTYISPSVKKLRGYTVEEALEKSIDEALTPKSIKLVEEFLPKRIASYLSGIPDVPQIDEFEEYCKDGSIVNTEISTSLLGDEKTGLKILGVSRNITERKLAEDQKQLNEKRLESLININEFTAETENELLDYTLEEAINLTSSKIGFIYFYDEAAKLLTLNSWSKDVMRQCAIAEKQIVYELDKTGIWSEAVRQRKEIIVNDFQADHTHKIGFPEGHAVITRFLTIPVFSDKKIVAVVGVANKETNYDPSDVRQLKLLMDSAWKIVQKRRTDHEILTLSKAIEQSPASIMITDLEGNIEFVNKKFTEVTGYTLEEVKGQNPRIIQSGFTPKSVYNELWSTLKNGKTWSGELLNKKKDGSFYWESVVISPVRNKNIFKYIAVKLDITEQKKMTQELIVAKEKAEHSDKLKSEFLAQMSHEIRTPLNAMLSFSNLLKDDLEEQNLIDTNYNESIGGIQTAGKRIIRTIDLILNMAELQTGKYDPDPKVISLNKDILQHIEIEFRGLAKDKNLDFRIENGIDNDHIFGDEYSISQIFMNLVDNSIKYTRSGHVKVKLFRNGDQRLKAKVEDTGIGISKDYMLEMFKPFSQEDQGYSRQYEGNGLGLALVKRYCELNNIEIDVESEKGKGTTFTLTFNNKTS